MSDPTPIHWRRLFEGPLATVHTSRDNTVPIEREVVPVVVVPGTMGSRLKRTRDLGTQGREVKKNGRVVKRGRVATGDGARVAWDPDDAGFLLRFTALDPAARRRLLIGTSFRHDYLSVVGRTDDGEVDERDRDDYDDWAPTLSVAGYDLIGHDHGEFDRGWAGLHQETYVALLRALDRAEWSEPIVHCFELPVHGFGYNWTQSNARSGLDLVHYIEGLKTHYQSLGRECERVILVSHSMGGLVCRQAARTFEQRHGSAGSPVLGVAHIAQPTQGSVMAYQRMKGGVFGWVGVMLGQSGEAVTPLLANMPGALELLPTADYRAAPTEEEPDGARRWISYTDPDTGLLVERPQTGDPYAELYRERHQFYRLVDEAWLDPQGVTEVEGGPWIEYLQALARAEGFHRLLGDWSHPDSVQVYGAGFETADRIVYERYAAFDPTVLAEAAERLVTAGWGRGVERDGTVTPVGRIPDWVMSMHWRLASGDETVTASTARALDLGDDQRTVILTSELEGDRDRHHQGLPSSLEVQHVTRMAIENFCLSRIESVVRPPPGPPARPPRAQPNPTLIVVRPDPGTASGREMLARSFYLPEMQRLHVRLGWKPIASRPEDVEIDPYDISSQVAGIDFDHPVEIVLLYGDMEFSQWQVPGGSQGSYYSLPSAEPEWVGVNPVGDAKAGGVVDKVKTTYWTTRWVYALRSTAGPILDTWSSATTPYYSGGGYVQYYSTSPHFTTTPP